MTTMFNLITKNTNGNSINQRNYSRGVSLEIEAEFSQPVTGEFLSSRWAMHGDGSLRGYGYEFITRSPFKDLKEAKQGISSLLETEDFTKRYLPSSRTSTHVHYNVQHITEEALLKILLTYYLCENQLNKIGGIHREGNLFCLSLSDAEGAFEAVKLLIDQQYLSLVRQFDLYKYAALNIANVAKIGTIEFRQFRGTNNVDEIFDWLRIIQSVIKYSEQFDSYTNIIFSYLGNPKQFIESATLSEVKSLEEVDSNYSLVYNILRYIEEKPERDAIRLKNNRNSFRSKYKFTSEQDMDLNV